MNMKTITRKVAMMCMALVAMMAVSSCSEDQEVGMMLEGSWEGKMGVYVEDEEGTSYESVRTQMTFGTDPFRVTRGDGYWVDFYRRDFGWGTQYIASHIRWRVDNGVIKVHFREDDYDIEIRDYSISNNRFKGEIHVAEVDGHGNTVYKDISFSMYKLDTDPYWDDYYYYDRGVYDYDYYYAPARNGATLPKQEVYKRHFKAVDDNK